MTNDRELLELQIKNHEKLLNLAIENKDEDLAVVMRRRLVEARDNLEMLNCEGETCESCQ